MSFNLSSEENNIKGNDNTIIKNNYGSISIVKNSKEEEKKKNRIIFYVESIFSGERVKFNFSQNAKISWVLKNISKEYDLKTKIVVGENPAIDLHWSLVERSSKRYWDSIDVKLKQELIFLLPEKKDKYSLSHKHDLYRIVTNKELKLYEIKIPQDSVFFLYGRVSEEGINALKILHQSIISQ